MDDCQSWTEFQFDAYFEQFGQRVAIVDAMLGTGSTGSLREPYLSAVASARKCQAIRIAIDLPTGLAGIADDGEEPIFKADLTLTFVARKTCFENGRVASYLGDVQVVDIGAPSAVMEKLLSSR